MQGLNDTASLLQPLFTDPQNAGPAPSVKDFCVVITLRSPIPEVGRRGGCVFRRPLSSRTPALLAE